MSAAAILNFGKMSITPYWIQISAANFMGRCTHGHAEMITWRKVETGSLFAWRHQMNVWSISVLISVTITDIWTKFDIELKHHTINMTECAKFTRLENQDGGGRHLGFPKMSITPNWIKLFAQNLVGRCITAMRRWHMTKTRNRKFICVTSLN